MWEVLPRIGSLASDATAGGYFTGPDRRVTPVDRRSTVHARPSSPSLPLRLVCSSPGNGAPPPGPGAGVTARMLDRAAAMGCFLGLFRPGKQGLL